MYALLDINITSIATVKIGKIMTWMLCIQD